MVAAYPDPPRRGTAPGSACRCTPGQPAYTSAGGRSAWPAFASTVATAWRMTLPAETNF
ncbi:MAG: hypothetical protein MZV64_01760 [Ignavibacteriales bacterium]|nr:hypothetical protein [Ignavibacteriales bacterium]